MNVHKNIKELEEALDFICRAPKVSGTVELIVCRPAINERKVLTECELSESEGLIGDTWKIRGSSRSTDGFGLPDMQLNLVNARVMSAIAGDKDAWAPAGDQFFIDLDISKDNLPPGSRLRLGSAMIEVTAEPHLGCRKFSARFGKDAVLFVNSELGKALNLRGICAKVVVPGNVRMGDFIRIERPQSEVESL